MAKETIQKDVVIIGAGMAGLTAALYAGRMNFSTLVLENAIVGGQIANATGIENYPGFLSVSGSDLIQTVQQQAEKFGAVVDEFDAIEKVTLEGAVKRVETESAVYETPVVIIASGMSRRKLPLAEEAKYAGRGVHYCELCDGHMYQDKIIAVMGGARCRELPLALREEALPRASLQASCRRSFAKASPRKSQGGDLARNGDPCPAGRGKARIHRDF